MADESRTVGDGQEEQAMSDTEPLSDERLAEIRESVANTAGTFRPPYYFAVVDLLAEVERLRASPPPRPLNVEALARELARTKGWSLRIWTVARAEGAERIVEIARRAHEAWQTGATDAGSPAIDGIMVDLGVELGRATSPAPRSPHPSPRPPDVEALLKQALREANWLRLSYDSRESARYEVSLSYPDPRDGVGPTLADALRAALNPSREG